MNCPKCGNEINDGMMYCEKCGTEILIVTDYDMDIDNEMEKTMSDIVSEEFASEYDVDFDDDPNLISMIFKPRKGGKVYYIFLGIVMVAILIATLIFVRKINIQNSYEYQIEQAEEKVNDNNLLGAISNLEKAYKINPNAEVLFTIANYYYTLGRENDAIFTLTEITTGKFLSEDVEMAYRKIISLYDDSKNYVKIAELLEECTNEAILKDYDAYKVYTPSFNVAEGTYEETMAVKILCDGPGNVYYTVDGSTPNSNSLVFTTPVFLEYGSYTIKAVYINKYGVSSDEISAKYLIDVDFVFEPDIITEAGEYTEATLIVAEVPLMYTLYYTTDGTDPSRESTRYTGPIPMKEGENTYKFISYASDGTESTIVERTYILNILTVYTPAEAVTALIEHLFNTGYLNRDCTKPNIDGTFDYMYIDVYPIEEVGSFYLVYERYKAPEGNIGYTNVIFAVNVNDLSIHRVRALSDGEFVLED